MQNDQTANGNEHEQEQTQHVEEGGTGEQKTEENTQAQQTEPETKTESAEEPKAEDGTNNAENSEDEPQVETKEETPAEYEEYDDPRLSACVDMLKDAGISVEESNKIFGEAIDTNDLSKVDVDTLKEKLGDTKATLMMAGLSDYYNTTLGEQLKTVSAIKEALGGEEGWAVVKEWADKQRANNNLVEELDAINDLFNKGGKAAMMGADKLKDMFTADPNTKQSADLVTGDTASAGVGEPITNLTEYFNLMEAAHRKGDTAEIARIEARRDAARKK